MMMCASLAGSWRSRSCFSQRTRSWSTFSTMSASMICGRANGGRRRRGASRAGGLVAIEDFLGRNGLVDDDVVGRAFAEVFLDGADVVGGGVAIGLAGLGDDVADVDHPRVGAADRARDAAHEQVGDDAGVQTARPDDDGVGLCDFLKRLSVAEASSGSR